MNQLIPVMLEHLLLFVIPESNHHMPKLDSYNFEVRDGVRCDPLDMQQVYSVSFHKLCAGKSLGIRGHPKVNGVRPPLVVLVSSYHFCDKVHDRIIIPTRIRI